MISPVQFFPLSSKFSGPLPRVGTLIEWLMAEGIKNRGSAGNYAVSPGNKLHWGLEVAADFAALRAPHGCGADCCELGGTGPEPLWLGPGRCQSARRPCADPETWLSHQSQCSATARLPAVDCSCSFFGARRAAAIQADASETLFAISLVRGAQPAPSATGTP